MIELISVKKFICGNRAMLKLYDDILNGHVSPVLFSVIRENHFLIFLGEKRLPSLMPFRHLIIVPRISTGRITSMGKMMLSNISEFAD